MKILPTLLLLLFSIFVSAQNTYADDNVNVGERRLTIQTDGQDLLIPYFRNYPLTRNESITRVIIVIHGINRNGDDYYNSVKNAAGSCPYALKNTMVIAPVFLTLSDVNDNEDLDEDDYPYWDRDGWPVGHLSIANESQLPRISSFAVIDQILDRLEHRLPNLRYITIAGHSAGGQFTQRYFASSPKLQELARKAVNVKGIVANPSSYLYFTDERITDDGASFSIPNSADSCPGYNNYRYGLNRLNSYLQQAGSDKIKKWYSQQKVTYLIGETDTKSAHLDQSCGAILQGSNRLERGKIYEKYLNKLYRRDKQFLERNLKFYFIPGVGHSHSQVFDSAIGRQMLFPCRSGGDPCSGFNLVCEYRINDSTVWKHGECAVRISADSKLDIGVDPNGLLSSSWTGPNGFSKDGGNMGTTLVTNKMTEADFGTYSVTAEDGKGCSATANIEVVKEWAIGGRGPGGGIIFYVNDDGTGGLEVSPTNVAYNNLTWQRAVEETPKYVNPDGTTADWRLPSKDELTLMLGNLRPLIFSNDGNRKLRGLGNSLTTYWSSTEDDSGQYAWAQTWGSGTTPEKLSKNVSIKVRAVRDF